MCSKATSLSFNRPKQTFGLSSKCPESHEIKSMPGQRNLLFLWWPTVFRPFLGHPFAAEKKEAMWGQKVSTATATTNGLPKIRLIWRIYLSDWTSRPFSLWGGNRQRGQMWHTLTHGRLHTRSWGEGRLKAGKSFQTHSNKLLKFPSSSAKLYATVKPSHLAMFCPS